MSMEQAGTREDAPTALAVVCDRHTLSADRMTAFLQERGWSGAKWYALRDLDEVDAAAGGGRVATVVFVSWSDLLEGIWTGEVNYGRWLAAGTRVEFVESPTDAPACLATVSQAWDRYEKTRRKRNALAGLVLSIIVILAAFVAMVF